MRMCTCMYNVCVVSARETLLAASRCVCVCVCVRERERERGGMYLGNCVCGVC
jgi:hypothetical protein